MLTVCTGWSAKGWSEYGQRFAQTFDQFWHQRVRLIVYGEEPRQLPGMDGTRDVQFLPLKSIAGFQSFYDEYSPLPAFNGRKKLNEHHWKERAVAAGYNWRYDAVKFSRQGFIPLAAFLQCQPGDYLAWLDGDVVTHAPVLPEYITSLLPADKHIAYLGRGPKHPEIGFQLYRVGPVALAFLREFERIYRSDEVFSLKEWHSAYVWAHALESVGRHYAHDLTPGGSGHVWHESPLRRWTDHLKGERKHKGRSPERKL